MIETVVKFDGSTERYDREKIVRSIMSAGGSRELAEKIVSDIEREFESRREIPTRHIRRALLIALERNNAHDIADTYLFYDRVMKGRITFELGKFIIVDEGNLYTGRSARRIGSRAVSSLKDVHQLLEELSEDMNMRAMDRETIARRSEILTEAVRRSDMNEEEKERAIGLIADFRRRRF